MNISEALLKEHSKANSLNIAEYIGEDKVRFKQLIEIFIGEEYRLVQRSAWVLSIIAEKHPFLIKPYLSLLVKQLHNPKHDTVKRNILRILQFIEIPDELMGELADICFNFLTSGKEAIAIKVFAITVLEKIVRQYPELKYELIIIIEDQMPYSSAGFKSRGTKILKALKK
ncbi:hypothetical protein [Chondrinema litorale]|uniref:hypothetical protein n=1 Tax=Chondrinema litorale TaxID=2994555 RepID=UPI002542936E|nr:hypothetical protein [Chondrinema litorale]UZR95514.1 hypothetical protein OQ292_06770 [Chondrinema litorale]